MKFHTLTSRSAETLLLASPKRGYAQVQLVVGSGVVSQVRTTARTVAAHIQWLELHAIFLAMRQGTEASRSGPCHADANTQSTRPHLTSTTAMVLYASTIRNNAPAFCLTLVDAVHRIKERIVAV